MSEAVDRIQLNIELKKLRAFFDSFSSIVMLEGDPLPNFAAANDTHSRIPSASLAIATLDSDFDIYRRY